MGKNAVILVDKGEGITSFDCLGRIKRNINRKTGHCGTLDKFAHGLMIVLCGSFTHLVPVFMDMDKTYEAEIEFGKMTVTLDPEGETVETGPVPDEQTVRKAVESFVGPQVQIPPAYSAIHINGKRSYQMARNGETGLELQGRDINIYSAEFISWDAPVLKVRLNVSKGTYIRSYARDIGHACGSCAYVRKLYRTQIGPFSVSEAIGYDDEQAMKGIGDGENLIKRISGCCELELSEEEAFKASNGYVSNSVRSRIPQGSRFAILKKQGRTVCIYSVADGHILCQVRDGE